MTRVQGEIVIRRPPEVVFDFVADERNEPRFNSRMTACELVSGEPIGAGSRFRATVTSARRSVPMTVEFTGYDRPRRLASHSTLPGTDVDGELLFEPAGAATRMSWSWQLRLHGPARLLAPVASILGDREERRIWAQLKSVLEDGGAVSPGRARDRSSWRARDAAVAGARRRAYRGGRPGRSARAANRVQAALHAVGIGPRQLATLQVRGRRSGRVISFPVVVADYEGERYLVAMLGSRANWVRNVEAADGQAVLRRGRREQVRLEPVPVAERPPVLRRYLQLAPGARAHIPVDHRATLADFTGVAGGIPVFRIVSSSAPTEGSGP